MLTHERVVTLKQLAPARIAKRRRMGRGVDDVREEHGREHAFGLADAARAGEEALCLVEDRVVVLRAVGMVGALQLDEARSRDDVGQVAPGADRDPVLAAVHHQGGDRHARGGRADVDALDGVVERASHSR